MIPQGTIRRGARCSSAKAFLGDAKGRSNLHVVTFSHVLKLMFNNRKEAIGVVFERFSVRHRVYARKEVIVSAGSINTPQLLMLSGKFGFRNEIVSLILKFHPKASDQGKNCAVTAFPSFRTCP